MVNSHLKTPGWWQDRANCCVRSHRLEDTATGPKPVSVLSASFNRSMTMNNIGKSFEILIEGV